MELGLTDNAIQVLKRRYLIKNEAGDVIESPEQMFQRVARHVANGDESDAVRFYEMMTRRDFMPNTPCLANAGRPGGTGMLSACFVLGIDDSMESIFETLKQTALIFQSGGGVGFSFSRLRPEGDFVRSTTGTASGPISFMMTYDAAIERIKQGSMRRGAAMGMLRVDHPDILKFIDAKRDLKVLTNFNVSVAITDAFMDALACDSAYNLINPRTASVTGRLRARDVWDRIVESAHHGGEPGLFFIDRVNQLDPLTDADALGPIEACNPCGEVALHAEDSCNLASINLGNFVMNGEVDLPRLGCTVEDVVRFLDNVIAVNRFPLEAIRKTTSAGRKIGLGVMGWADMLIKLGIRYDSDAAVALADKVMGFINERAVAASEALAQARGPFRLWPQSKWAKEGCKPRRNATVTVVAPTGSVSLIAGCSSGIEPLFALAMVRKQAGLTMSDVNPLFVEVAKREGWYSDVIMAQVTNRGTCTGIEGVPTVWQEVFRTAGEIAPEWHVKMQAAFQRHVELAVSKTVNLSHDATVADVDRAYRLAWELGCKGITVYRDKSRDGQTLSMGAAIDSPKSAMITPPAGVNAIAASSVPTSSPPVERRSTSRRTHGCRRRRGETLSKQTAYGTVHVTVNYHPVDNAPFECFIQLGKSGQEVRAMTEALGRAISYSLTIPSAIPPRDRLMAIAEQFAGIGGGGQAGFGEGKVMSAPDAIGQVIRELMEGGEESPASSDSSDPAPTGDGDGSGGAIEMKSNGKNGKSNGHSHRPIVDFCPDCHQPTLMKGRCDTCSACGFSKC
jgi:ribonucleoside-diphosphate reductase alpha chain